MSGALGGAASGAAAGSALGPWGTLAGAVVGGAASYFGGQATNAANAQQAQQMTVNNMVEAGRNRDFQANSAQDAMRFEAAQADLNRSWQRDLFDQAQWFNAGEANKNRAFQHQVFHEGNAFSAHQAQVARDYNTNMANTAYQRATTDMRAAGINPMLAYMKGGADSPSSPSPSGGSAGGSAASSPGAPGGASASGRAAGGSAGGAAQAAMQNFLTPAFNSAAQGAQIGLGLEQLAQNIERTRAETSFVNAQTASEIERPDQIRNQISHSIRQQYLIDNQTRTEARRPALVDAQAHSARAQAGQTDRMNQRFDSFGNSVPGNVMHSVGQGLRYLFENIRPDTNPHNDQ